MFYSKKMICFSLIAVLFAGLAAGCGGSKGVTATNSQQPVEVKVMEVIVRDTPITYEFIGQVQARNEVQIRAMVSGFITEKMVEGGAAVRKGQPLFQLDRRQYETAMLAARAQLAQSEAELSNTRIDTDRYRMLAAQEAISRQTLDTALSAEEQRIAQVNANRATLQQTLNNLDDTLVRSPIDGRIEVNELSVGSFVEAGATMLATVSSVDPVFVQFSMSENEYLHMAQLGNGTMPTEWGRLLTLVLSDGTEYPLPGHVEQVDRGLSENTGTLTLKASFDNPQGLLVPGMFARVIAQGEMREGAILVPQRAVQELLGKTFITVVAEGDKAESRAVTMGPRIGNLWLVTEGLSPTDRVVVEGNIKIQPGSPLKVIIIGPDDLKTAVKQ